MSKTEQQRDEFLPKIADAFADLGYRGATTAKLAELCGVRENVLYRIWPSKKAMFLASIGYVFDFTVRYWQRVMDGNQEGKTNAEKILLDQAADHGKMRFYRIVFAGLSEDDPDVRKALRNAYRKIHKFMVNVLHEHREMEQEGKRVLQEDSAAWGLIGLGAVVDIQHELGVLPMKKRAKLMKEVGRVLLGGDEV